MIKRKYCNYKISGADFLPNVPENWDVIRGKFVFNNQKILNSKLQCKERLGLTLNGVIERTENDKIGLSPSDFKTYQIFQQDELVFKLIDLENYNTSRVGYVFKKGIMSSAYIRLSRKKRVNVKYFYYQYYDFYLRRIFNFLGLGVRATLSAKELLNIPIVVPPLETQTKIAVYLDRKQKQANNFIAKQKKMIELLKEQKKAIINQAVTKGLNPNVKMKDSGVEWLGEIPEHWEVRKLKFLGTCQNGISQGAEYFGSGFPFVSYGDIYKDSKLSTSVQGLANSSKKDQILYSVKKGDIFFTRTSETIEEIGYSSTCFKSINKAVFSGFLIRFRPFKKRLAEGFSRYYFRSQIHRAYFVKEMNIVTRTSLSQPTLKKLQVLLPSLDEQLLIAKYIESKTTKIDSVISKAEEEIKLVKEYLESLIFNVVTGQICVE